MGPPIQMEALRYIMNIDMVGICEGTDIFVTLHHLYIFFPFCWSVVSTVCILISYIGSNTLHPSEQGLGYF